jgi:hypothetical protein
MEIKQLKPQRDSRYKQGYINPKSCKKLFESISNEPIIYRSSYEYKFIVWLENDRRVKAWGSECICIPYMYSDGTTHRYYPDYFVEMVDGTKMVIEIKPSSQTRKPVNENCWLAKEYSKNVCKWKEAMKYCKKKGYEFRILTEKTINQL